MRNESFIGGYTADEFAELLLEHLDTAAELYDLLTELEEHYGGELVEASFNAGEAVANGKLPIVRDYVYAGYYGEYHHLAFKNENGERFVERVAFE